MHTPPLPLRAVLEDLRSGLNVGAFFRTADSFGCEGLDLCGYTAHPPQRDILKSALGATETVPWRAFADAATACAALRSEGYRLAAVEQAPGALPLSSWRPLPGERWAFIFGNEVHGVQPATIDLCDIALELPQFGLKRSLNVSVCGGVVLWHAATALRGSSRNYNV